MAGQKKNPEAETNDKKGGNDSLRADAEKHLAGSPGHNPGREGQTPEELIHELRVHQIELEMQAEELRNAHLALEESRDKYRDLYDFSPVGYLTLNDNGLIEEVNLTGAALLGVDRRSIVNTRFSSFITRSDAEAWFHYFMQVQNQKEEQHCALMLQRKDGSVFPSRMEGIMIHDLSNQKPVVRLAFSDITDIRRAEDALQLANKKLNLLSSITRHDINNQILVLGGFLDLLHEKVGNPALEHCFTRISEAGSRITSIIRFTSEYTSIGIKNPAWQDCSALVEAAAGEARHGHIVVKNEIPAGTELFADPLVGTVFRNLVDNAVRHGGKISTIRFFTEERNSHHVLVCKDDGDGIPLEEKEKIFELGYGRNTGLGLALARDVLAITGITIRETGEPGRGARFEMQVPEGAWRTMKRTGAGG
jgi:PAS domain S-box-containing protein